MDRKNSFKTLKNLALPFVLTATPLGACIVQNQPSQPPLQESMTEEPPLDTSVPNDDETTESTQTIKKEPLPAAPASGGKISQAPNGTCWWNMTFTSDGCPEGAICNPPPPRQVECPDELKKK